MGLFDSGGSASVSPLFQGPKVAKKLTKKIFKGKKGKENFQLLQDFLTPPAQPPSELELAGTQLFKDAIPGLEGLFSNLEALGPVVQDLVDTGFRTDAQPIIDQELRRFERETVPGVAQRFGSALSGSGFQNDIAQAAADLGIDLGALQVGLDEAAAGRRITGLQAAPSIFAAPTAARFDIGGQLEAAGGRERAREIAQIPGATLAQSLGFLTGIETQQGFKQTGGTGQPSSFASILGSLGNIANPNQPAGPFGQGLT